MNKVNEGHAERFENDKPDSLNKIPQKNISANDISIIKLKDITQYIGKKIPKSKKKILLTQTVIEELLDTSLTPLASKYLRRYYENGYGLDMTKLIKDHDGISTSLMKNQNL